MFFHRMLVVASMGLLSSTLAAQSEPVAGKTLGTGASVSDTSTKASTALEEVVVTAKSRAERLQDVPLSISSFSGDVLRRAGVVDVRDLQKIAPSLNIFSGAGRNDPSALALRGVTANTSDERFQSISFFVDGVPLSGQLLSLDLAQISRVEVIRGPQSATFGRATYTGAVNYITRDPEGDDVSGSLRVRGGYGDRSPEANHTTSGYVSFPVVSHRMWASIGGTLSQVGGYYEDANGASIGRERTKSVTASMLVRPSDALRVKGSVTYSHDRDTTPATTDQHPREWLLAGVPTVVLSRAGGSIWPTSIPDPALGIVTARDTNITADFSEGGSRRNRYFGSLVVEYNIGGYELSYRGGYFRSTDRRAFASPSRAIGPNEDPIFGPLVASGAVTVAATSRGVGDEEFQNTSQQLLLLSPSAQALRWKIGAYYFREADKNWLTSFITPGNPSGRSRGTETITNLAAFGGIDYDITDEFTLSLEGRQANEKVGWNACATCFNVTATDTTRSDTAFTPRVTLTFKPTVDNLLYALYSRGTKSARFSYVTVAGTPRLISAYPEELDNFEIGSKNTLWDGRATLNLAVYKAEVTGQQLLSTNLIPVGGSLVPVRYANNVGTSRVRGFELDAQVQATERLRLTAGVGYADQEFTTTDPIELQASTTVTFPGIANAPVVLAGKAQSNVPKWNGNASAEYVHATRWDKYRIGLRADVSYRSEFYGDLANIAAVPEAWKADASVRLFSEAWEFSFYSRNIFNSHRALGTGLAGATTPCSFIERDTATFGSNQQCLTTYPSRPREVGVEVQWSF